MSVKNRIPERDGKTGLKPPVKSYIVKPTRIPKTLISITNNKEYAKVMAQIDELIKTPDSELTKSQANELHKLA